MTKARVIRLHAHGGPEVLTLETIDLAAPLAGEVQVRQTAIGFNYIDVYQRSGFYPLPLPSGLGHEAVGVIEAIGESVEGLKIGDRVGYINAGLGAYADRRNVPANRLMRIPASISDSAAAALIFKGMTAQYLLRRTYPVQPGDLVLVHAAAGGVGRILCQWAKALGATVIGTASTPEKCAIARASGAHIAINYAKHDWVETLLAETGGRKARVVYDSVAKDTFLKSLDCCAPFGMVVLFGAASGPAPAIEPELLNKKGCLFLTRPSIFPHNADLATFRANAADLFAAVEAGMVTAPVGAEFSLAEIGKAHAFAESRASSGSIVIVP